MQKSLILSAILFIIIIGCSSTPEIVPDPKQVTFLTNGIWLGMLPCADCEGIDYQLNLKNDYTFKQKSVYKGKSENIFINEGTWGFVSDSVIAVSGNEDYKMFIILGNDLVMLDKDGNRIESNFEERYHLSKDDGSVKETKEVKPVPHVVEMNLSYYQEKFLNGIDFFARGNEPNWTLEIDLEKSMAFATMYDIKLNTPAVEGIKAQEADVTLYSAKTDSGELIVTIIKDKCQDNMSGEYFPYKVRIEAKTSNDSSYKTFEGCGKYLYDIRLHDIWVMKEMTESDLKKEKLMKGMPQFEFNLTDMRFAGHAGCNSISGPIDVVDNKITFGNLMGTLMACPNMKVEKAVVNALNQKTVTYSIDKLKLTLVSGKTKMVFQKVD
ncbi:MAG TPA: copper resistance protein NlpE N-terminal domain-containing protein [Ignavibacteriaceae bacterium]